MTGFVVSAFTATAKALTAAGGLFVVFCLAALVVLLLADARRRKSVREEKKPVLPFDETSEVPGAEKREESGSSHEDGGDDNNVGTDAESCADVKITAQTELPRTVAPETDKEADRGGSCSEEPRGESEFANPCEEGYGEDLSDGTYATPSLEELFPYDDEEDYDVEAFAEEELAEDGIAEKRAWGAKLTFVQKMKATTPENKAIYNAVKNDLLSYRGVKSRIVGGGDYFRKRGKQLAKIVLIGSTLRLALALDPAAYDYNIYHQRDRSGMKKYADTPMFVKIRSRVGVYRACGLIADMMAAEGKRRNGRYIALDYAREIMMTTEESAVAVRTTPHDAR